jgi:hypothetical protein
MRNIFLMLFLVGLCNALFAQSLSSPIGMWKRDKEGLS